MIRTFADKDTKKLWETGHCPRFAAIERVALRKLEIINAAISLDTLRIPPGNRLEQLKGKRLGQHSIRINSQWRICFTWRSPDAEDVEICDYH